MMEFIICIHYLILSSPHAVRATTLSFHMNVSMYVFNVKSYTECLKNKKRIKKAVTGLVSVPVSKTFGPSVARWPRDEGICPRGLVDE